jgi:hypothetical protein
MSLIKVPREVLVCWICESSTQWKKNSETSSNRKSITLWTGTFLLVLIAGSDKIKAQFHRERELFVGDVLRQGRKESLELEGH